MMAYDKKKKLNLFDSVLRNSSKPIYGKSLSLYN